MQITSWLPEASTLSPDIAEILRIALEAAASATSIHQKSFGKTQKVSRKELRDIVTKVDLDADASIKQIVRGAFPEHGFLSEESPRLGTGTMHTWVVDPLDGTVNYAAGIPFYSASIAVQREGETIIGVVQSGALSELYIGVKGFGAYRNGTRLQTSNCATLGDAVVSFMLTSHYNEEQQEEIFARVRTLSSLVRGLRLYVSQALELCYIAGGRLDGHICIKSRGFSGAAGTLILREAGGCATDMQGTSFGNGSRSIIATNSRLHTAILEAMDRQ
jgi:myo-inositol-1(or 4)-monophosphatase